MVSLKLDGVNSHFLNRKMSGVLGYHPKVDIRLRAGTAYRRYSVL